MGRTTVVACFIAGGGFVACPSVRLDEEIAASQSEARPPAISRSR
jgi:hypothetical protein